MKTSRAAMLGLVCFLVGLAGAASAQAPDAKPLEDRYVAARDAAVKKIKALYAKDQSDAASKAEEDARPGLEAQMRAILGPVTFTGFTPGKLNLDTLSDGDMGYGMLDGLRFDSLATETIKTQDSVFETPTAHITATTQALFARWLRAHKTWLGKGQPEMPQTPETAFRDGAFYGQAIQTDAAIILYGELPVVKPAGASVAVAMLANRSQDQTPDDADEVFVAALANGRAIVASAKVGTVEVAACTAARAAASAKAQAAFEAARKRGDKSAQKALEANETVRDAAFMSCFAAAAPKAPAYAAAVTRAQTLLEMVAAK